VAQDAVHLIERAHGRGEVLECYLAHEQIEGVSRERQIRGIALPKLDRDAGALRILARDRDEGTSRPSSSALAAEAKPRDFHHIASPPAL
jgi:hypothetical protein